MTPRAADIATASQVARGVIESVSKVVVGRPGTIRSAVAAMLAGGHVLFEDLPGLAKTQLAKAIARAAGLQFSRIQFTPDLLPADISGSYIYNMRTQAFDLRRGPVFAQMVLADELNRAPPKTQAALLEAMQESQVTLEGRTMPLPAPFHVFATQNPIESEGVYLLPEAQVDRFLMRLSMGYPTPEEELEILDRVEAWDGKVPEHPVVADGAGFVAAQSAARAVFVHPDLKRYIVSLVQHTRQDTRVQAGASPRGAIGLMAAAKASAVIAGRAHATDDDVKALAQAVLAHRILLDPEHQARGAQSRDVVAAALEAVPTPRVPLVAGR
jgi:MoxR-like ATPase